MGVASQTTRLFKDTRVLGVKRRAPKLTSARSTDRPNLLFISAGDLRNDQRYMGKKKPHFLKHGDFQQNIGIEPKNGYDTSVGRPITLIRDGSPIDGLLA
jgi:hypothetical protein